ncbi:hypothetical protein PSI15_09225 [Xenorhabdus sp. PR6a]|uniref:hypothetical protein n=1 Tax=Xenorhabdus sp. PR6a TaxID=3025877 RepID=UPI002359944C|nr:hypothetical protein [Xenorhabdus sp. PR6a]MDC9581744.1 hypothetical protein [Xenorhabdus sp. PR6a]
MEKTTETLMMEHGFTLSEINKIKSASQRSGYDIKKEILILSHGFYGVVMAFVVILLCFLAIVFFVPNVEYFSVTLTFFIAIFIFLFFCSPKLRYKSFMFIRKHKG